MTEEQLQEIEGKLESDIDRDAHPNNGEMWWASDADMALQPNDIRALMAEVRRLQKVVADYESQISYAIPAGVVRTH